MNTLLNWDRQLFLWLNGFHSEWLDQVMFQITKPFLWLPLYLFLLYMIFRHYKREGWLILCGAAVAILISDQITSTLMKPFFARLRPSHDPSLQGLVHSVNGYYGGLYGFASGHAASTMATAFFLWLTVRETYRWIVLMLFWSLLMMYSRIYLGVHYPGDVLVGMLIGILGGWVGYRFYQWLKLMVKNKMASADQKKS